MKCCTNYTSGQLIQCPGQGGTGFSPDPKTFMTKKKTAKKTAAKKTAAKKTSRRTPAKKSAGKRTAVKKAGAKKTAPKKKGGKNKLGVKNSLVNNINARKKKGISRKKKSSTVSRKQYRKMEDNWGK